MIENFGPGLDIEINPEDDKPINAKTLYESYHRIENRFLASIVHAFVSNESGWWLKFSPMRQLRAGEPLLYKWNIRKGMPDMMDPAPEETAPSYLTYTEEEQERRLVRYSKGFKILGDHMLSPKGKDELAFQLAQLSGAWWNAIKLLIAQTAIYSKLYWQEKHREGIEHRNVLEAMTDEVNNFGILSYDEKGIMKLASWVRGQTTLPGVGQGDAPNFTMVVVPPGLKEFLGHAGDYTTESYRAGEALTETIRNVGGAQAMTSSIPTIEIFEDQVWNLVGLEEQDANMFQKITVIGEWTMIDGSDYSAYSSKYPTKKMLSIKIRNVHGWSTVSIKKAINKSFRWDGEGRLSHHHQGLVDRLAKELDESGFRLTDDLVDPYVYRNDSGSVSNGGRIYPSEDTFKVVKHWGDVDSRYRTLAQDVEHGRRCIANLQSDPKRREDFEKMRAMKDLMTQLYDSSDVTSAEIQGYFFSVAANPENKSDDFYLKANDEGCVQPCHVEKNPSRLHREFGSTDQAEDLNERGIMYVVADNGVKHYVWVFEPDSLPPGTNLTIDFNLLTTGSGGEVMRVDPTSGALRNEEDQFLKQWTDRSKIVPLDDLKDTMTGSREAGGSAQSVPATYLTAASDYPNLPFAFVLAPFDRWGRVSPDGTAPNWNSMDPPSALVGTHRKLVYKFILDTLGSVDFRSDSMNVHFSRLGIGTMSVGVKAPRLVAAPKLPFGYGTVTGMRTLRQLYLNGDRGWDQGILEIAYRGVEAMDRFVAEMEKTYPESTYWDSKYAPTYMASGNERYDRHTSVMGTIWDHVKYPLLVRKPIEYDPTFEEKSMGVDTEFQWIQGGPAGPPGDRIVGFSADDLRVISETLGFDYGAGPAGGPFPLTVRGMTQIGFASDQLEDYLGLVLSSEVLSPEIRNLFKNTTEVRRFAEAYRDSGLSESYTIVRNRELRNDEDYGLFAHFFRDEVMRTMNRHPMAPQTTVEGNRTEEMEEDLVAAVRVFQGVAGLVYTAMHNSDFASNLDRGIIGAFEMAPPRTKRSRGGTESFDINRSRLDRLKRGDAATFPDQHRARPSGAYINTRLAVSQKGWHGVARSLAGMDSTAWAAGTAAPTPEERARLAMISKIILRPSDPNNPSMPLAGIVVDYRGLKPGTPGAGQNADLVLQELLTFKHARSHAGGEGSGIDASIFANAPLVRTAPLAGAHQRGGRTVGGSGGSSHSLYSGGDDDDDDEGYSYGFGENSFSPYDAQPQHVNPGISRDLSGPLFTTQEFQDRTGNPLDNMTRFVEKRFMKIRYDHAIAATKEDDFDRVPTILFLLSKVTKRSLFTWVDHDCPLPDSCFVLARPWIRLKMDAAFFAEPGALTSETRYAYPHLVQQYDGTHKTWLFHLTSWMDSAVYDPSKIMTVADVKFSKGGYQGGFDDIMLKKLEDWNPTDPEYEKVSMLSFSCGANFSRERATKHANPMNLFGKHDPSTIPVRLSESFKDGLRNSSHPHYPSFLYYNYILRLTSINSGTITNHDSFKEQKESGTHISGMMFRGKHYEWSQHDEKYSTEIVGTGHLKNMDPPFHNMFNGMVETKSNVYN